MSKIDGLGPPDLSPEAIKKLLEEGERVSEEIKARWRRAQRSEEEVLRERVAILERRVDALERGSDR